MNKNRKNGFSLTEILIVLGVVAVLCATLIWVLRLDRKITRDARRISDVKQIQAALEMHYNDENVYPASVQAGAPISGETSGIVYMNSVPGDPLGPSAYGYKYVSESPYAVYAITFNLERGISGLKKGVHQATIEGIE